MENALSPKKPQSDHTPNVPMKEAIGNFTSNPHYVKLYNAVQAAYTNYKVKFIIIIVTSLFCLILYRYR